MKIGILTFHRAANYGAVLQAYALQQYLLSLGHDVEVIDYRCVPVEQMHSGHYFLYCKGIKNKCKQFLRSPVKRKKRKLFDDFIQRKIHLSTVKKIRKETISQDLKGQYDVVISGSDQIWNPYLTQGDNTYLLDFADADVEKISYAASIGLNQLPEEYKSMYQTQLGRFAQISVREKQGQMLIRKLVERDCKVVLDPTLLISAEKWKTFMKRPSLREYVLLYTIKSSPLLLEEAIQIAEKKNLPIIYISDSIARKKGITYIPYATPEEWVGLFAEASHVVTNSFHGVAFSINFNKSVTIGLSGDKNHSNSRILDLLQSLGIGIQEGNRIEIGAATDWQSANKALYELKEQSRQFFSTCHL